MLTTVIEFSIIIIIINNNKIIIIIIIIIINNNDDAQAYSILELTKDGGYVFW